MDSNGVIESRLRPSAVQWVLKSILSVAVVHKVKCDEIFGHFT